MVIALRFANRRKGSGSIRSLPGITLLLSPATCLSAFTPKTNGVKIATLMDQSSRGVNPVQSVPANQPTVDLVSCPGRVAVSYGSGQHMKLPAPTDPVRHVFAAFLVPASAAAGQIILTQDTSATTDKPAFEVQVG